MFAPSAGRARSGHDPPPCGDRVTVEAPGRRPETMPKDRRGDSATESADPPIRLVKHIEQLGLRSRAEYLDWCQRSGFERTLDKTRAQLEHERHVVRARAGQVAQLGRLARKPRRLIEQVCAGQVAAHDIARPQWRAMCERIEASSTSAEARRSLGQLLLKVH